MQNLFERSIRDLKIKACISYKNKKIYHGDC